MKKGQFLFQRLTNQRHWAKNKIIIVLSVLLCTVLIILYSAAANVKEVRAQLQQNLTDVAKQNAEILRTKVMSEYDLITGLSKELQGVTPDTIEESLNHFKILMDDFNLKRFAFCFPDGTTYSTDTEGSIDLSFRDFFQEGMKGKCYITGVLTDALREEHAYVNVMTVPIFDEKEQVSGVFGLAYDTNIFNESLQIDSFDGQGYSCVINQNGEIIASSKKEGLELTLNFFDVLKENSKNEPAIADLQSSMQQNTENNGTLYLSGQNFYSCIPVKVMDCSITWYVLTIIPADVLNQRLSPFLHIQSISSSCIIILFLVGALTIILSIKEQHRQKLHFAYLDPITQGANYKKFCITLNNMHSPHGYLIAMDISNFNNISIVAGQAARNQMIKETWECIHQTLRGNELACHVKDEDFLLFLTESEEHKLLQRIEGLSKRISATAKDFHVYGIQAAYGIYLMTHEEDIENAYSKAKLAREYALPDSNLCHAFYNEANRSKIQYEKQLEERFPSALESCEFEVWYQPKYSAVDCTIVGSEALVRWKNGDGKMISPGEFIPLFERNGMIIQLDEYMFRSVCRQQKQWLDEGKQVSPVSINVSRASLYCIDIDKRYAQIMQEYEISPEYIQLEITETVMENKTDIRDLLNKFRRMGIKILMDDFGTGYSSLATLSTQCFDTLKLDKTLIDHIGSKDGETMLYHIIRMGQQMGLHITAEGVEKETQLAFLQKLKCDDIQGFYFSRPIPKAEYEEMLRESVR